MAPVVNGPIGILDEHPEWSTRLIAELDRRGLAWEKVDHSSHGYDPRERRPVYSVIVNRTSPSSHTRGHAGVLFYAEALLDHYESLDVPVINPVAAYRFEKSKALQLGLCERLGVRYPRTVVVNHRDQVLKALDRVRFPLVIKPNVGGSGAGIVRFAAHERLEEELPVHDLAPNGPAFVEEYLDPRRGHRALKCMGGQFLYAIRILRAKAALTSAPRISARRRGLGPLTIRAPALWRRGPGSA